uniref:Uncharacterized protein n=1 Tax=Homalodisca liturata TaxID=320908 RepID=A0A1B6JB56_9HEMI
MRTKSYLLGFTCIVATSILLIIFGDQRPVQNILTETHKQLKNNLQTFKDNLKEAEEKRWTADEKYLKALGFTTSPRLYPAAVWTNTSLPIVVSYLLDGDAELGVGLARNIAHHLPNNTLLLYNLGLGRYDLQLILTYCNTSRCAVVDFYLSDFPSHVSDHKIHAFRPIIIQDALNHAGAVLFMENNLRLTTGNIQPLVDKAKGSADQAGSGIICWATRQAVTLLTHPAMFHYFHTTDEGFKFLPMVEASRLLIFNTPEVHTDIMLPWIQCSLTHDCILPIGAQSNGCRFDKKPQYRYSGCHSHDSSALNILLGLKFEFDDTCYATQTQDTYFHSVTASRAAEELARLQENVTDATTDS